MDRLRTIERVQNIGADEAAVLRRMPGAKRLEMLDALVEFGRGLMLARLRETHPEWSEERCREEVSRRIARAAG